MKLDKASDEELQEILYPELNDFVSNQEYLANNSKSRMDHDVTSNENIPQIID